MSNWIKSNSNAIHSLQNLSEDTLAELYKYAKALVFPSFIEGFGWPPLEAAVRGCPVITTRTGAIADLLGNYARYVEAKNQPSIEQSVQELLQSPESKRNQMSLPTHEDCRRKYFDLYEQMMAN
jgi:glycosyltransferase involved in cell wall biosynthesis